MKKTVLTTVTYSDYIAALRGIQPMSNSDALVIVECPEDYNALITADDIIHDPAIRLVAAATPWEEEDTP